MTTACSRPHGSGAVSELELLAVLFVFMGCSWSRPLGDDSTGALQLSLRSLLQKSEG